MKCGEDWNGLGYLTDRVFSFIQVKNPQLQLKAVKLSEADKLNEKDFVFPNEFYEMKGAPYAVHRQLLSSQFGAPCNPPPWGSITAVDLVSVASTQALSAALPQFA